MSIQTSIRARLNKQYFYQRDRVITEMQGQLSRTLLIAEEHLIAQLRCDGTEAEWARLAIDIKRSVLGACRSGQCEHIAYMPYGFHRPRPGLADLPAFNGELQDAQTAHYFLGSGYRQYNTVLMRFQSPDSWSPFGEGGLNSYAFVKGDPINQIDPTGHMPKPARLNRQQPAPQVKSGAKTRTSEGAAPEFRRNSIAPSEDSSTASFSGRLSSSTSSASLPLSRGSSVFSLAPAVAGGEGWTLLKANAKFKAAGLTAIEQQKFDTFQNAIYHFGLSPKNAAMLIGGANYKQLDHKAGIFQIRLSLSERVIFTEKDKVAEIRQVGGHT